jgi:hypothetical protein
MGVLLLVCASASAQYIPPQELKARFPVVGILPMAPPLPGEEVKAAAAQFDAQIASVMRSAGFEVFDADAYRAIEDEYRRASGGWFDPNTGTVDEALRSAVFDRSVQAFQERHKLRAFISAHVEPRQVEFVDITHVFWDGVQENLLAKTAWFLRDRQGKLGAISLQVLMFDEGAVRVFESKGGIGATSAMVRDKFVQLDLAAVLSDADRISRAVQAALWPLTHNGESAAGLELPATADNGQKGFLQWVNPHVLLAAAATPAPSLSRTEIRGKVTTIALRPIPDPGHPKVDQVRSQYEAQLASALQTGGFKVMPSEVYAKAFDAAVHEVNGIYDRITGEQIAANFERAQQIVYRKLREEQGVDAILDASFDATRAPYDKKGQATWDGAVESIFVSNVGFEGKPNTGVTNGVSLAVKLIDSSGKQLYEGRGGVELTSHYSGDRFRSRPREELLLDSAKTIQAVRIALSKLVEGP